MYSTKDSLSIILAMMMVLADGSIYPRDSSTSSTSRRIERLWDEIEDIRRRYALPPLSISTVKVKESILASTMDPSTSQHASSSGASPNNTCTLTYPMSPIEAEGISPNLFVTCLSGCDASMVFPAVCQGEHCRRLSRDCMDGEVNLPSLRCMVSIMPEVGCPWTCVDNTSASVVPCAHLVSTSSTSSTTTDDGLHHSTSALSGGIDEKSVVLPIAGAAGGALLTILGFAVYKPMKRKAREKSLLLKNEGTSFGPGQFRSINNNSSTSMSHTQLQSLFETVDENFSDSEDDTLVIV